MAKLWPLFLRTAGEKKSFSVALSLPEDRCFYWSCLPMRPFKSEVKMSFLAVQYLN